MMTMNLEIGDKRITAVVRKGAMAVCGLYSFFEERNKEGFVLSFGANERTKENIHPHQGLPLYGEDANEKSQKPSTFRGFEYRGTTR